MNRTFHSFMFDPLFVTFHLNKTSSYEINVNIPETSVLLDPVKLKVAALGNRTYRHCQIVAGQWWLALRPAKKVAAMFAPSVSTNCF